MTEPSLSEGPAPLRLPDPRLLFEGRAARLAELAARAGGEPWLAFLSRVASAQRAALGAVPGDARAGSQAHQAVHPEPVEGRHAPGRPLEGAALPSDPALRPVLLALLEAVDEPALPAPAAAALRGLRDTGASALERLAAAALSGRVPVEALAAAPFAGAALQVLAAARAARLDPAGVARAGAGCPVCGAPPVAGLVQGDRLRYLACGLCAAEWHLPRLRCATCGGDRLGYHHLEHDPGARAETCDACRSYVKLFDLERRPGAEPLADDAATLALDLLMGEAGYGRGGLNLLVAAAG